jgi:hypothetical protein
MLKLKVLGRNAVFSLKTEVDVGRQLIVSTATATAVYCTAMPAPRVLEITRTIAVQDEEDKQVVKLQRQIELISNTNRQQLAEAALRHADRARKKKLQRRNQAQAMRAAAREVQRKKDIAAKRNRRTYSKEKIFEDDGISSSLVTNEGSSPDGHQSARVTNEQTNDEDENEETLSSLESDSTSSSSSSSSSSSESESFHGESKEPSAAADTAADVSRENAHDSDADAVSFVEPDGFDFRSDDDRSDDPRDAKSIASAVSDFDELEEEILKGETNIGSKDMVTQNGEIRRRRRRRMYRDDKLPFVLEIDDETDEDFLSVLLDKRLPDGLRLCTTSRMPDAVVESFGTDDVTDGQMVMSMLRFKWNPSTRGTRSNLLFSSLFQELFAILCKRIQDFAPAVICGVRTQVNLTPDDQIELVCYGKVILTQSDSATPRIKEGAPDGSESDDTRATELEIHRREEKAMSVLLHDIEASISVLKPHIGQNRSTVIVDKLSDVMNRRHRSPVDGHESGPLVLPIPVAPPIPVPMPILNTSTSEEASSDAAMLGTSPKSRPSLSSSLARLSPRISPKPIMALRSKTLGPTSLPFVPPEAPISAPSRSEYAGNANVRSLSSGWMRVEEVPVELTPLHTTFPGE